MRGQGWRKSTDAHLTSQAVCRELTEHHQLAKMHGTEVMLLERNKAVFLESDHEMLLFCSQVDTHPTACMMNGQLHYLRDPYFSDIKLQTILQHEMGIKMASISQD